MKHLLYRSTWTFLLLAIFIYAPIAVCQVLYGTVVGTVTDPDGHAIPGASVKVTDTQTGISHTQTTNSTGEYSVSALLPGFYPIAVSANGFGNRQTSGVVVSANLVVRSDQQLSLSNLAQTVEVNASSDQLQTDTASIHGKLTSKQLSNLPIGGF